MRSGARRVNARRDGEGGDDGSAEGVTPTEASGAAEAAARGAETDASRQKRARERTRSRRTTSLKLKKEERCAERSPPAILGFVLAA